MQKQVAYFLIKIQTLRLNNSRILKIKNAKFFGVSFFMNANIWRDFQICTKTSILDVAVALDPPLNTHEMLELLLQWSNAVHYNENSEYYIIGSSF